MRQQPANDNSVSVNANSSANAGNSNTDENGVVMGGDTGEVTGEFEKDKIPQRSNGDNTVSASSANNLQTNDRAAGADKTGTAERKPYGDIELNKGLEAQARDEEGA